MTISAIAQAYWRKVKAGERTYESVPAIKAGEVLELAKTDEVLELAKTDVVNGVITAEDFCNLIGTAYEA